MRVKLFRAVPFARAGYQEYVAHELGRAGSDVLKVYRPPGEVKRSAQSFNGVPVTVDHPDGGVSGDSVSRDMVGIVSAPFYDESSQQLKADFLIWEEQAIAAIADGLRELSGGYAADYQETAKGLAQRDIQGNHVALVPKGRSGSAQRIGG